MNISSNSKYRCWSKVEWAISNNN